MRTLTRLLVPLLVLAGAACGSDDDDQAQPTPTTDADGATTTTSTTATAGPAPYEGYGDHEPAQYAGTSNWICHPDLADDECTDLSTTVIGPDGTRTVEDAQRAPAAETGFDCFYVYPTTSSDPTPVADLDVNESERDTVRAQVGRYASTCRVFAPAYRQVTLSGLGGQATPEDRELGYADVLDAWKTYVNEENDGRGVVLIGHSQGAGVLRRLVTEEIDPDPELRELLVSALLLGSAVAPDGEDGFESVPACATATDVGCVVSFASYPADQPPAEGALFGKVRSTGAPALCVDPLELIGEEVGDAVLVTGTPLLGATGQFEDVTTPFVSLPDAVRTSCEEAGGYRYLAVGIADPADPRPVTGLVEQRLGPTWGLHLLDANVVQDDLIELVTRQAEAWAADG